MRTRNENADGQARVAVPSNCGHEQYSGPLVTFFDDDAGIQYLSEHVPVYRAKGVRGTFAVVASRGADPVGITTSGDPYEALNFHQVRALVRDGFDMQSHTWSHDCHVFNTSYYSVSGVTEKQIDDEFRKADEAFRREGLSYNCMTFPFGARLPEHFNIARRYAMYGVNTGGGAAISGINVGTENPMDLTRFGLGNYDESILTAKSRVDVAIEKNAWLIFMLHAGSTLPNAERLSELIDYVQQKGVRIATFTEAVRMRGASYYAGDGKTAFSVQANGVTQAILTDATIKDIISRAYALGYMKTKTITAILAEWPSAVTPFAGEAVDAALLTVTATYSDNTTQVVTDGVSVTNPPVFSVGNNVLSVKYGAFATTVGVTASAAYSKIGTARTNNPTYSQGDKAWFAKHLDAGTYTARVVFSKSVSLGSASNTLFELRTATGTNDENGTLLATVTYGAARIKTHITATFTLSEGCDCFYTYLKALSSGVTATVYVDGTVAGSDIPTVVKSIVVRPKTSTRGTIGNALTAADIEVVATYSDGTAEEVSGFTIEGASTIASGVNHFVIRYQGASATYMLAGCQKKTMQFVVQPNDLEMNVGANKTLYAIAETSDGTPVSYQWYQNVTESNTGGTAIANAITTRLSLAGIWAAGTYYYYCVAESDGIGTTASDVCSVTVSTPDMSFTLQPSSVSMAHGHITGSLTAEATVMDDSSVTYQWYVNTANTNTGGSLISGETNASFSIPTDLAVGAHYYYCVALSEAAGAVASNAVMVSVYAVSVTFSGQLAGKTVNVGNINDSLTASASANDGSAVTYQWYENTENSNAGGTLISGATDAMYTLPTDLTAGTYYYYCVASSATAGTATSNVAIITAVSVNYISRYDLTGTTGEAVQTIADIGACGNDLVPAGVVMYAVGYPLIGATGSMLTIPSVSLGGASSYTLHMKWTPESYRMQNRIFALSDGMDMQYNYTGTSLWFKIEKDGATLYSETLEANMLTGIRPTTDIRATEIVLDIAVTSDVLTLTASAMNSNGLTFTRTRNMGTITGFTAALLGGLILGNRASGDRYLNAKLKELWVTTTETISATVSITAHPRDTTFTAGAISGAISVTASASDGSAVTYQWYGNTLNTNTGGTLISGETNASFAIPSTLTAGTYYY